MALVALVQLVSQAPLQLQLQQQRTAHLATMQVHHTVQQQMVAHHQYQQCQHNLQINFHLIAGQPFPTEVVAAVLVGVKDARSGELQEEVDDVITVMKMVTMLKIALTAKDDILSNEIQAFLVLYSTLI